MYSNGNIYTELFFCSGPHCIYLTISFNLYTAWPNENKTHTECHDKDMWLIIYKES